MITVIFQLAAIATFIWIGFICAISFMEAWLKFRAPGVTLPIGLSIGRLIFNALNKMEWFFIVVICSDLFFGWKHILTANYLFFAIAVTVVIFQTIWILPKLDARAELHIQNKIVPPSKLHVVYVVVEILKLISLIIFGLSLFGKATL